MLSSCFWEGCSCLKYHMLNYPCQEIQGKALLRSADNLVVWKINALLWRAGTTFTAVPLGLG